MDCQSYVAFVIEVVGTLGLSIGPNITWNEITLERTDDPITTGNWENETISAADRTRQIIHFCRHRGSDRRTWLDLSLARAGRDWHIPKVCRNAKLGRDGG